ncbi:hypothetical protein pdam_00025849, partial [Pocillopora damicornis]
ACKCSTACKCFFETREASVCSESSARLLKLSLDRGYALTKHPVKGTTAAVNIVDESKNTLCMNKIEHFSSFHHFEYGDIGLRVWKCYGISKGKYIPYDDHWERYHNRTLQKFNVVLLRAICSHFDIPVKLRDKKQILIDKLSYVISDC